MHSSLRTALRLAALAVALVALPAAVSASTIAADPAAQRLGSTGRIDVAAAGPYVEVGTYRIQVSVKLGRAHATLPDGTWLYENYSPENSAARGTLVVRFAGGRVSELFLATPAVVASLRPPAHCGHAHLASAPTPSRR
jgi:hypothetical protein